jgi:hypothetical protein
MPPSVTLHSLFSLEKFAIKTKSALAIFFSLPWAWNERGTDEMMREEEELAGPPD